MESPFAPTKETANEYRVSYCVKYVFSSVLRDILRSKKPEGELRDILKRKGEYEKLEQLVEPFQLRLLYPFKGYSRYDISLLFILIKIYCDLPAPKNGWDGRLEDDDRSLSASLKRIKKQKNYYGSHNVQPVSDKEIKTIWKEYDQILNEVLEEMKDSEMNKKYANVIKTLRTVSLDPKSEANIKKLEDEVGRLEKRQSKLESRQKGLEIKMDQLEEEHAVSRAEQVSPEKFASLEERLEQEEKKNIETTKNLQKHKEKQKTDHSHIKSRQDTQEKKLEEMEKHHDEKMRSFLNIQRKDQEKILKMEENQGKLHARQRELENKKESSDKPTLTVDSDLEFPHGTTAVIHAKIQSSPTPESVFWQKSKQLDSKTEEFEKIDVNSHKYSGTSCDPTGPKLVINNTTFEDGLFYRLVVANSVGTFISSSTFLNITGSTPSLFMSHDTDFQKESVKLNCRVHCENSQQLTGLLWTKDNKDIDIHGRDGKYSGGGIYKPSLKIRNVDRDDAGMYQCRASNAVGSTCSKMIKLGPPEITLSAAENSEKGVLEVYVSVQSIPDACKMEWKVQRYPDNKFRPININDKKYKGSTVSLPDAVLVLNGFNSQTPDMYKVEVTNFIGVSFITDIVKKCQNKIETEKENDVKDDSSCLSNNMEDNNGINIALYEDNGDKIRYNNFRLSLIKGISEAEMSSLKDSLREMDSVNLESLNSIRSVTEFVNLLKHEKVFTERDVIYLQYLMRVINRPDLERECIKYAKIRKDKLCYFQEDNHTDGCKLVKLHVVNDIENFTRLDSLVKTVAAIVECDPESIKVVGILRESSFFILMEVEGKLAQLLLRKTREVNEMVKLTDFNVDRIEVDGVVINIKKPGKQQGEKMTSLLNIREEGQEKFSKMEADQKTLNTKQRELENRIESTEIYQDRETRNIFENTKAYLQSHRSCKLYKKTSAVNETIKRLKEGHIAILTGKQGTGKTTTALQIMCEMSDESSESPVYKPALIKSPEQWDKAVNVSQRFIIYLDDFIGRTNFNSGEFENWKNQLDFICSCSKTWNVCVLLGLRQNILDEARLYSQHEILREEYEVNLSSKYKVKRKEKEEILTAYEKDYAERNVKDSTCGFSNYEREKIIDTDPFYGFPLTCSQFFSRPEFFNLGVSYFKQSDEMLRMAIEQMRKSKDNKNVSYCVLCYVLINGDIEKDSIDVNKGLFQEIRQILRIDDVANVDIKDAIDDLHRLYLSKKESKDIFTFSHETVLEAVFVSFGQVAPKMIIEKCKLWTLYELIRTQNNASKPNEVVVLRIPRENYNDLAQRLLHESDNALMLIVFYHPVFNDPEFVSFFFNPISKGIEDDTLFIFLKVLGYSDTPNCDILLTELLNSYGPHHSQTVTGFFISTDDIKWLTGCAFSLGKYSRALCMLQYIEKHSSLHHLLNTETLKNGQTPLHYCIEQGWEDMMDKILTIHTPRRTEKNWSCVHLAAHAGRLSLLQKFIGLGQNLSEKTSEGFSVLETALRGLAEGRRNCSLPEPEEKYFKETIEYLLRSGTFNVSNDLKIIVDEYENNIVHYLVINDCRDILKLLIQYNRQILSHRNNNELPTTLHVAVYLGRPWMVETLSKAGVRPIDSDMSLQETLDSGEKLCGKLIRFDALKKSGATERCYNDGENEVLNLKVKSLIKVTIKFGNSDDFKCIKDFLQENL